MRFGVIKIVIGVYIKMMSERQNKVNQVYAF